MDMQSLSRNIADAIKEWTGACAVTVTDFRKLSGGAIQSNYNISLEMTSGTHPGSHRFVVRSDAPSQIDASLSRAQEFAVLRCAREAGVTVPEPLWLCTDKTVIGYAFYVMSWAPGTANGRQLVKALTQTQATALTYRLGQELGRLHRIGPGNGKLDFLPIPSTSAAQTRITEYRQALDRIAQPHPVLEWALNWLQDHAPPTSRLVLCHCDFRTGNYMVAQGELTAVLDWEFAAWSDPYEDLGWLCAKSWRFGNVAKEVGGVGDKPELFSGYASVTGERVDASKVGYWEVMAMVRWSVIALQQAQRHVSGKEVSLELALTGRMVPEMEFDILSQCLTMGNADAKST
ncbi:MAG TPA: phosphotransferase family protein [Advenella sp.]|nr:phosphotransferase family protein [Advenella sp.]